ncbi:MAG: 3-phosphoshikimate 1-carboxyvinyltransferase, partial [Gemmatimonadaceae bacterium]
ATMSIERTIRVPGDKSISHRALMLSSLANGRSRLRGLLTSADVRSTAGVLRELGVSIPPLGADVTIDGRGLRSLRAPVRELDCGNSGTTARLMAGMVASFPWTSRFTGDESLSRRPMARVAAPLRQMGAHVDLHDGGVLPMSITGAALRPLEWKTERASAQVKSAILLAAATAGVPAVVREPCRTRDHTERMLRATGAEVSVEGVEVRLAPTSELRPLDLRVPADPSSAAYVIALVQLSPGRALAVPDVCLNETRMGFYGALRRMGGDVQVEVEREECGEPVGVIRGSAAVLEGISVEERDVPSMIDELPLLACLAARARGETVITGAGELRVKESDRITAVVESLRAIGADAEETPDGMRVVGGDRPLRGMARTWGDHRLAMAFGILAALPGNEIVVDDPGCVEISYPAFWDDVRRATA